MRFSIAAGVDKGKLDDWFDPVLEQDSPLYIDPYLMFEDDDPFWAGCYDRVVEFFETATELVLASGGNPDTPAWRKAMRLLMFPEPHELALGVSLGSPRGAGTGEDFAREIGEVLSLVGSSRVASLASLGGFALFCKGIGPDRISDIVSNILKDRLIEYTRLVNARHSVALKAVKVRHIQWDATRGRWEDDTLDLFPNEATGGGVLLVPERFLKDIPRIEADEFWNWASLSESAILRDDLNYDLSESLSKSEKVARARRVARERPAVAMEYIERVDDQKHDAYNVSDDPKGLVNWYEGGAEALASVSPDSASRTQPQSECEFDAWVLALAKDFQFVVENTDAWRLLWDDAHSEHRPEKIGQAIAGVMWRAQCKAANIDMNKETNVGRGPVDFKFSTGWTRKALIEMKYIGSSKFWSGAEKQLPQYMKSEELKFGVYLAIGFNDTDFSAERIKRVRDTCDALRADASYDIKLVLVDARPKQSASRL